MRGFRTCTFRKRGGLAFVSFTYLLTPQTLGAVGLTMHQRLLIHRDAILDTDRK